MENPMKLIMFGALLALAIIFYQQLQKYALLHTGCMKIQRNSNIGINLKHKHYCKGCMAAPGAAPGLTYTPAQCYCSQFPSGQSFITSPPEGQNQCGGTAGTYFTADYHSATQTLEFDPSGIQINPNPSGIQINPNPNISESFGDIIGDKFECAINSKCIPADGNITNNTDYLYYSYETMSPLGALLDVADKTAHIGIGIINSLLHAAVIISIIVGVLLILFTIYKFVSTRTQHVDVKASKFGNILGDLSKYSKYGLMGKC